MNAALIVAVVAVVLAGLSLAWQAASFLLTGARIKVSVLEGLRRADGGAVLFRPSTFTERGRASLAADGYTERVVGVVARNVGRMPTTIRMWDLRFGNDATYTHPQGPGNEELPRRLDTHDEVAWYTPLTYLQRYQANFVDDSDKAAAVVGGIRLGTGKRIESGSALVVRANRGDADCPSVGWGRTHIRRWQARSGSWVKRKLPGG